MKSLDKHIDFNWVKLSSLNIGDCFVFHEDHGGGEPQMLVKVKDDNDGTLMIGVLDLESNTVYKLGYQARFRVRKVNIGYKRYG